ncbi:hypothetical protein KA005_42655, partial [bacterium]|nr:hypothetical protein [bacterium]
RVNLQKLHKTTLIDLYNLHEIPAEIFLDDTKSEYICMLPEYLLNEVNNCLKYLRITNDKWIRMQPNKDPY